MLFKSSGLSMIMYRHGCRLEPDGANCAAVINFLNTFLDKGVCLNRRIVLLVQIMLNNDGIQGPFVANDNGNMIQ